MSTADSLGRHRRRGGHRVELHAHSGFADGTGAGGGLLDRDALRGVFAAPAPLDADAVEPLPQDAPLAVLGDERAELALDLALGLGGSLPVGG